jgi:hypothetical protein
MCDEAFVMTNGGVVVVSQVEKGCGSSRKGCAGRRVIVLATQPNGTRYLMPTEQQAP